MYLLEALVYFCRFPYYCNRAISKRKSLLGLVSTFSRNLFTFAGLFMSMSNTLKTFYPITAIFGISGYYETTIQDYICSLGILILCGCISAILLKNLNHRQRKTANE